MSAPLVARRIVQKLLAEDEMVTVTTSRGVRLRCKVTHSLGKQATIYIEEIEEQPVLSALLKAEL